MEGPHGQLGSRLADGLCGNHTDSLADIDAGATRKVTAIALAADACLGLTQQRRPDQRLVDPCCLDRLGMFLGHHLTGGNNHITCPDIDQILGHHPAQNTVIE
ncbi:MAG: Uncharacterised protein [SAR116 cluster bacterium]|nr:MAG: Uncharacterised protein [SAR116 cluster bacterium]